jgi:hypothetical protein
LHLLLEISDLLALLPHLDDVLKRSLIGVTIADLHHLILVLLDVLHFWNALELVANNLLQMNTQHSC